MSKIDLGFNCNCFTNRYDEPEEWTSVCVSLGIKHVMFSIDLIDPYWPWDVQKALCDRTLNECLKKGIHIDASFGGQHGHQHYLGHPDELVRREAERFFQNAIRQSAYLGSKSFGTCFAIQTVRTNADHSLRSKIIHNAISAYYRLAEYASSVGLSSLAYEMTSVERETCATFAENDYILNECKDMAVPMRVCLDMGHRNRNGIPEEANHLAWIRRYGKVCDVIDCQQTTLDASCHWPFTVELNERGVIRGEEIIQAIRDSGAERILLAFELRCPAFYPEELRFIHNLEQTVSYWRQFLPEQED